MTNLSRDQPDRRPSALPHRMAMAVVSTTFPLIWIGGLVTTTKSGMAVYDWPNTYGDNLFLYPLDIWINGPWDIFIEHGHRLWGSLVGVATIALVLAVWARDDRRWLFWAALAALAAVIFQGLLGGMRVRLNEVLLARIHGCFGPLFFALATAIAVFTSRFWRNVDRRSDSTDVPPLKNHSTAPANLFGLALLTATLAYAQLTLGSLLRHVPAGAGPSGFRLAVWAHVLMALVVAGMIFSLAWRVWRGRRDDWVSRSEEGAGPLVRPAGALAALVAAQLALGVGAWVTKYNWPDWLVQLTGVGLSTAPLAGAGWSDGMTVLAGSRMHAWITTGHVAVGSLILATAVMLALRLGRLAFAPTQGHLTSSTRALEVAA